MWDRTESVDAGSRDWVRSGLYDHYLQSHSLGFNASIHHDKPSPSLGPGQRKRLSRGRRTAASLLPWGLSGQVHVAHNLGLRWFTLGLDRILT